MTHRNVVNFQMRLFALDLTVPVYNTHSNTPPEHSSRLQRAFNLPKMPQTVFATQSQARKALRALDTANRDTADCSTLGDAAEKHTLSYRPSVIKTNISSVGFPSRPYYHKNKIRILPINRSENKYDLASLGRRSTFQPHYNAMYEKRISQLTNRDVDKLHSLGRDHGSKKEAVVQRWLQCTTIECE